MNKKISSLVLAGIVIFSMTGTSFASYEINNYNDNYEIHVNDKVTISTMTKSEIVKELKNFGFNNQEIDELFQRELEKELTFEKNNLIERSMMLRASFPSNPYIGQIHTEVYSISNAELGLPITAAGGVAGGLSKSAAGKALIKKFGLSALGWYLITAGAIVGIVNTMNGYDGFNITVEYRYGEDNHMSVSWTPGPVSVESY